MKKEVIVAYLKALSAMNVSVSDQWVRCSCPLAPWFHDSGKDTNPSFGIKINAQGDSYFNCYSCKSGDLMDLVLELQAQGCSQPKYDLKTAMDFAVAEISQEVVLNIKDYDSPVEALPIEQPWPEAFLASFPKVSTSTTGSSYLDSRGVPQEVREFLDIRYDSQKDVVAFPIRNWKGEFCLLRGRRVFDGYGPYYDYSQSFPDKKNQMVWLGEHWVDFNKTVVMVESVFDLASVLEVYANVLAPLSVGISESKALRVSNASQIVTMFDHGQGGDKARGKIERYLKNSMIHHIDPMRFGASDPGEMSVSQINQALEGVI